MRDWMLFVVVLKCLQIWALAGGEVPQRPVVVHIWPQSTAARLTMQVHHSWDQLVHLGEKPRISPL